MDSADTEYINKNFELGNKISENNYTTSAVYIKLANENDSPVKVNNNKVVYDYDKETNEIGLDLKEFIGCTVSGDSEKKNIEVITSQLNEGKQQLFGTKTDITVPSPFVSSEGHCNIDDGLQPLSERWSPVGANYEDAITPSSELLSPESELELCHSDYQEKLKDSNMTRLRSLEEEQEFLTTSLMALTSHFAHVQLRVRQIVEALPQERDQLLKDLEEFAFRGIPETPSPIATAPKQSRSSSSLSSTHSNFDNVKDIATTAALHQHQFELIEHLKSQLIDLEKIAYESGAPVLPQHILLEKQKIIIDELKQKLNFRVDEQKLPELTTEELKSHVDNAIGEFVGPFKMKEQLVVQLKTQITDLERFIAFLQCDTDETKLKSLTADEKISQVYNSYAVKNKNANAQNIIDKNKTENNNNSKNIVSPINNSNANTNISVEPMQSLHSKAHGLMDKASVIMQIFATTHFAVKTEQFQKNTLKRTKKGNHWGDLRAQLEVDIQEVSSLAATLNFDREKLAKMQKAIKATKSTNKPNAAIAISGCKKQIKPYRMSSDSEEDDDEEDLTKMHNRRLLQCARFRGDSINTLSNELTAAVRKHFAMTLMHLMQHGLRVQTESMATSLMVPFMRCINPSQPFETEQPPLYRHNNYEVEAENENETMDDGLFSNTNARPMHAWELILEYYDLKHGDEYNNTPARKLSQSFNLEIIDSKAITAKQTLLSAVGAIIAMHRPYKRSYNAHFKALVCAGLNTHQLVDWLHLIFNCSDLVNTYYTASSYVACTAFRDALRSIDALTKYEFDLPVDLAIRQFRHL